MVNFSALTSFDGWVYFHIWYWSFWWQPGLEGKFNQLYFQYNILQKPQMFATISFHSIKIIQSIVIQIQCYRKGWLYILMSSPVGEIFRCFGSLIKKFRKTFIQQTLHFHFFLWRQLWKHHVTKKYSFMMHLCLHFLVVFILKQNLTCTISCLSETFSPMKVNYKLYTAWLKESLKTQLISEA